MIIGVPKEIKINEMRVGITPSGVKTLTHEGHKVYIETNAGVGSGFSNESYEKQGAIILKNAKEVYDIAEMILKVKEPIDNELIYLKENQILFSYLHLAPEVHLTDCLLKSKIIGVGYETVELENGSLPLLTPMSEVAGRMSVQIGAWLLEANNGGRGILLGGVPGVEPAKVMIIGGGTVGTQAAKIAIGLGAEVVILNKSVERLKVIDNLFNGRVKTLISNEYNLEKTIADADLVIGAVLVTGSKTPKIVSENMVKSMKKGSVIIDVSIDQGGCIETIDRITTHVNPYFEKHGVIHYSVSNMPGSVPYTSTVALTNATIDYALEIANKGIDRAILENEALRKGVNIYKGKVTHCGIGEAQDLKTYSILKLL